MRLLDTDTCIHIMRGNTMVLHRLQQCRPAELRISIITLFELYGGIVASKPEFRQAKEQKLNAFRNLIALVDFTEIEALEAAGVRHKLRKKGTPIGPYDVLLAATAISNSFTLVTGNIKEFQRVEGLNIEIWA